MPFMCICTNRLLVNEGKKKKKNLSLNFIVSLVRFHYICTDNIIGEKVYISFGNIKLCQYSSITNDSVNLLPKLLIKNKFYLFPAEIMYPDLFKGLNLRAEDLTPYSSPLISFEGKVIIPKGQIRLPVQAGSETVEVDFIIVDAYSPYTAIVARPCLHTLGAVSSTLHQKNKYLSGGKIEEILGDQTMARQCMIAAIRHKPEEESVTHGVKL